MEDRQEGKTKLISDSFSSADKSNKGYLSKEDYKVAIIQLFGYKPSKYELAKVWSDEVAVEQKGITFDQFKGVVLPRLIQRDPVDHIRQIFLAFDRFCHGFISLDDFKAASKKVFVLPHMPEERVITFFKEIDSDLDGRVSYRDFEMMMKSLTL